MGPASEGTAPSAARHLGLTALLALAVAGDFANFYITLSLVADEHPVITLLVVLALTAAAVALAHSAGVLVRLDQDGALRNGPGRGRTPVLVAMGGCWLALGLTAAVVRWFAPAGTADAGAQPRFGEVPTTAPASAIADSHRLTSLLLLALYLASGVLAAWIAYLDHGPRRGRVWWARQRLTRARTRDRYRHAEARAAEAEVRMREQELAAALVGHEAALGERDALAAELKAYARLLIASSIGDPAATGALSRRDR